MGEAVSGHVPLDPEDCDHLEDRWELIEIIQCRDCGQLIPVEVMK